MRNCPSRKWGENYYGDNLDPIPEPFALLPLAIFGCAFFVLFVAPFAIVLKSLAFYFDRSFG